MFKIPILMLGAGLMLPAFAATQDFNGDWQGSLNLGSAQLRLVLHLTPNASSGWKASLDSIDQGGMGIPVSKVTINGSDIKLELASIGGNFEGKMNASGAKIAGTWAQGGNSLPLEFDRKAAGQAIKVTPSDIDGAWQGALEAGGQKLRLVLHLITTSDGLTGSVDSLDQGAMALPVTKATRTGKTLKLEIKVVSGTYEGTIADDLKSIDGTWTQGQGMPLKFEKTDKPAAAARRPQNPAKPYPYKEEEVAYDNPAAEGVKLAGTLTVPLGAGPFPVALLITGSGPQDRDESLMGHKPFLVLSDYLTRKGIAVLRVDDRGVGKSTGKFVTATSADFATDVDAGVAYLKTRAEINPKKIGLIGHSEGGLIAPMVASRNKDIAWIVMMAGTGLSGGEILTLQQGLIAKAGGATQERVDKMAKMNSEIYAVVRQEADADVRRKKLRETMEAAGVPSDTAIAQVGMLGSPWFRYFLDYDPRLALAKVACPVLAVNGELDLQVPPKQNLPEIKKALAENKDVEAVELPKLNHLFQTSKTGSPMEYAQIEETISPIALDTIGNWILKRTR